MNKDNINFMDKILQFVLDPVWANTTYVCQDMHSIFLTAALKALLSNGICPKVIRKQCQILVLAIKPLNVRFITSNAYLVGDEFDLAEQFEIKFDHYFFPSKFLSSFYFLTDINNITPCASNNECEENTPCKINNEYTENTLFKNIIFDGKIPEDYYFYSNFDSKSKIEKKNYF
jgi:hypothetical protein